MPNLTLHIKRHLPDMPPLQRHGDWIDLYFCGIHPASPLRFLEWNRKGDKFTFYAGEFYILSLGISMRLPEGYEAHIVPRSSTFLRYGILQANSFGVIDSTYCGDNDVWGFPAYFTQQTTLTLFDRIAQFRLVKVMPPIALNYVESLGGKERGGFGHSGT